MRWAHQGIIGEGEHRHADKLIRELQLKKKQTVASQAGRESSKVRKGELGLKKDSAGGGAQRRVSSLESSPSHEGESRSGQSEESDEDHNERGGLLRCEEGDHEVQGHGRAMQLCLTRCGFVTRDLPEILSTAKEALS